MNTDDDFDDYGPSEGDYLIQSDTWRGITVAVEGDTPLGRFLTSGQSFKSDEEAVKWCRQDMERRQFWPNIWISWDRGDYTMWQDDSNDDEAS